MALLVPSKAIGSKKPKANCNSGGTLASIYERSDLLNKLLEKSTGEFNSDDRIEAINHQLS